VATVYTILIVGGRKPPAGRLAPLLNDQGYHVIVARTRREAWAKVHEAHPALIVLDSPSLRFDSHRFCYDLRDAALETPVLMLLPRGEKTDSSEGAHAHLHYPFSAEKLFDKIDRLFDVLRVGDVIFKIKQRCVIRGERETHLTPRQARLLELFMRHPGEILTRAFLMKQVWETDYVGDTRTLDVHIHWVRKAIEEDPASPVYLRTIRRLGYRLQAPDKE